MNLSKFTATGMALFTLCAFAGENPQHSLLPTLADAHEQATPEPLVTPTLAPKQAPAFTTDKEKFSYTLGADLGASLRDKKIDVDLSVISQGIEDAYLDKTPKMTGEEMAEVMETFQSKLMADQAAVNLAEADKNKREGMSYLATNKTKEGVVTTASGLQYKILTAGSGEKPALNDSVTVEYTGKLINGIVFDSTDHSGKPVTFGVQDVIPGWTEVLQLMPTGSTWEVTIPSNLAYGERGAGGPIGPNKTLLFTIHLLSVNKVETEKSEDKPK